MSIVIDLLRFFDTYSMLVIGLLLIFYVIVSACLYFIYEKIKIKPIKAIIPFYNLLVLFKLTSIPRWTLALVLVPYVNFIGLPIMIAVLGYNLGTVLKQKRLIKIGLMFLPVIFLPLLARMEKLEYSPMPPSPKMFEKEVIVEKKFSLDLPTYEVEEATDLGAIDIGDYISNTKFTDLEEKRYEIDTRENEVADLTFDYNKLYNLDNSDELESEYEENMEESQMTQAIPGNEMSGLEQNTNVTPSGIDIQPAIPQTPVMPVMPELQTMSIVEEQVPVQAVPNVSQPQVIEEVPTTMATAQVSPMPQIAEVQQVPVMPALNQQMAQTVPVAPVMAQPAIPAVPVIPESQVAPVIPQQTAQVTAMPESQVAPGVQPQVVQPMEQQSVSVTTPPVEIPTTPVAETPKEVTATVQPLENKGIEAYTFDYNQLYNIEPPKPVDEIVTENPAINMINNMTTENPVVTENMVENNIGQNTDEYNPMNSFSVPVAPLNNNQTAIPTPGISILDSEESFNTLQVATPPSFDIPEVVETPVEIKIEEPIPEVPKEELVATSIDEPSALPVGTLGANTVRVETNIITPTVVEEVNVPPISTIMTPPATAMTEDNNPMNANFSMPTMNQTPMVNQTPNDMFGGSTQSLLRENEDARATENSMKGPTGSRFIDNEENKYTLPKEEPIPVAMPTDPSLVANPMSIFGTGNASLRPTAEEAMRQQKEATSQATTKMCPNCGFIVKEGQPSCVVCGFRFN